VSTNSKDQLNSYHTQIGYYTNTIAQHPGWELVDSSRHTVRDVLQAAKEQGISWPLSDDITNAELEQLLFPNKHKASSQYAEPDYPYIHRELARSGVTLTLLDP
jgi:hypothetical protein